MQEMASIKPNHSRRHGPRRLPLKAPAFGASSVRLAVFGPLPLTPVLDTLLQRRAAPYAGADPEGYFEGIPTAPKALILGGVRGHAPPGKF